MKVLYIVNVPAPYMVNYFNELGKYCDLTVIFEKDRSDERDKSWLDYKCENFKPIILKGISTAVDYAFAPQIVKYLKRNTYDFIFISNMASLTGITAIKYLKFRKIPYFLESEGGFAKSGKGFKERFKKNLMKGAERYFSTTPIGDEYFLAYGATADKLVKYPFTSLYAKDIIDAPLSTEEKSVIREKLRIKEQKVVISVGRFNYGGGYGKGYDTLLAAAENMPKVGVYIIGGQPTQEFSDIKEKKHLNNVHFVDFKSKQELAEYYLASDVFVLMTRGDVWGLVINEAMACGLPVVTTDMCIAGMELVVNDDNGYILSVGDSRALAEKINLIINDEDKLAKMGRRSIDKIQWYTFESMAKVHIDFMRGYKLNVK